MNDSAFNLNLEVSSEINQFKIQSQDLKTTALNEASEACAKINASVKKHEIWEKVTNPKSLVGRIFSSQNQQIKKKKEISKQIKVLQGKLSGTKKITDIKRLSNHILTKIAEYDDLKDNFAEKAPVNKLTEKLQNFNSKYTDLSQALPELNSRIENIANSHLSNNAIESSTTHKTASLGLKLPVIKTIDTKSPLNVAAIEKTDKQTRIQESIKFITLNWENFRDFDKSVEAKGKELKKLLEKYDETSEERIEFNKIQTKFSKSSRAYQALNDATPKETASAARKLAEGLEAYLSLENKLNFNKENNAAFEKEMKDIRDVYNNFLNESPFTQAIDDITEGIDNLQAEVDSNQFYNHETANQCSEALKHLKKLKSQLQARKESVIKNYEKDIRTAKTPSELRKIVIKYKQLESDTKSAVEVAKMLPAALKEVDKRLQNIKDHFVTSTVIHLQISEEDSEILSHVKQNILNDFIKEIKLLKIAAKSDLVIYHKLLNELSAKMSVDKFNKGKIVELIKKEKEEHDSVTAGLRDAGLI